MIRTSSISSLLAATLFVAGCGKDTPVNPPAIQPVSTPSSKRTPASVTTTVAEDPIREDAKPEDFLGKWVGKWDRAWTVQFTVSRDPGSGELFVEYEWEERRGEPLRMSRNEAKVEKGILSFGVVEISLSAKDPLKAKAAGKFKQPRSADMAKAKS